MTRTGPAWQRALPGFVVSAVVLAIVFAVSDPRALWHALRSVPLWVLAAASALLTLSLVLRALSWQVLLGQRVQWNDAFWALNAGYLVNNIIPFRAGEAARALLVAPKAKVSFWHARFRWGKRLLGWALAFLDGLEALASPAPLAAVALLLAASWGVQIAAYGLTLRALVPQASYLWAAFALGSIGMGIAVPSAPGGLGVLEGVLVFVLGALGIDTSTALAYALAMHGVYYVVTGLLGAAGIQVLGMTLQSVIGQTLQRARTREEA